MALTTPNIYFDTKVGAKQLPLLLTNHFYFIFMQLFSVSDPFKEQHLVTLKSKALFL